MRTTDIRVKERGTRAMAREGTTPHEHRAIVVHALGRREGVPYEVERRVCATCARVLDERPLRRADA
jgi:hypothetical protein